MIWYSILMGLIVFYLAKKKGKNPFLWFIITCLVTIYGNPIFLILLLILFNLKKKPLPKEQSTSDAIITLNITPASDLPMEPEYLKKLWYFLDGEKNTIGPMSFSVFRQKWNEGKIVRETLIWNDSLNEWKIFKEFFPKI